MAGQNTFYPPQPTYRKGNTMSYTERKIYLAGPITGLTYGDARFGWREAFNEMLPDHIHGISPMRGKDYLEKELNLMGGPDMYPEHLISTPSGIVCRDRNDVLTSDAIVACFLGADRASLGTCIEFGWADAWRKPIIMVTEGGAEDIHWHGMLTEMAGYVTPSLEEAAQIVSQLLTPGI